jgi:uncharacterized protein
MKVVLDTNIFLSGIHWIGAPHKVLRLWFTGHFTLVTSLEINRELFEELRDFKIQLDYEEILWWESLILERSEFVIAQKKINVVKEDPDDNKFIEAAVEGKCKYIVTNDKHLLKIKEYNSVKILSPSDFLTLIK